MEQQHSSNKGKLEGFMAELGRKLDQLLDKARQGAEETKLSEKMEDLRQTKDKLEHELHEFVKDDEKWREVKQHLQGAAQELQRAFETTFARKNAADNQSGTGTTGQSTSTGTGQTNWDPTPNDRSADWKENNPDTFDWNRMDSDTVDPGANPK